MNFKDQQSNNLSTESTKSDFSFSSGTSFSSVTGTNLENKEGQNIIESLSTDLLPEDNMEKMSFTRSFLSNLQYLNTSTSDLVIGFKEIVPMFSQVHDDSRYRIGIDANFALNQGSLFQTGIGFDYSLNSNWSLSSGLGFEYSKFNNGPSISVTDKTYSFGSLQVKRSLAIKKRTSINLPIRINRRFNKLSINGSILLNYHFATNGILDDGEGNVRTAWISNDIFNSLTLNYQLGASYLVKRNLEFNIGLLYRNVGIKKDVNIENVGSSLYPILGLKYLIVKN